MKTQTQIIKAVAIALFFSLKAQALNQRPLSTNDKVKLAWALELLAKKKVIQPPSSIDRCIELDQDLIEQLESEGYIEKGTVSPQTICFGGTL